MRMNAIRVTSPENVRLEALRYRYPTRNAVTLEAEIRQIETCVARKYPRLSLQPLRDDWLSVVGYGPSLRDTWKEITHPVMTTSGAHDCLRERGITPDWHAECDGRDHKTRHLERPNGETTYLMASICNPKMWEQLHGCKVQTWHNTNGQHVVDWVGKNDDGGMIVAGGSCIGLTAIHLGGILGFRKFRLFGFDGNTLDGKRHAGEHYGPAQRVVTRTAGGRIWQTSPQMSNACDELMWLMRDRAIKVEIVGNSMMKALCG